MSSLGGRLREVITYQSSDYFAGQILHMVTTETYPSFKCLIHVKCQFRKKKTGPLIFVETISMPCTTQECDDITASYFPIIIPIICEMVAYWRSKTEGNLKLLALKVVAVACKRFQI